jgi:hypothetical protein
MRITPLSQLKHGMKVRCSICKVVIDDARISIDPDGYVFLCHKVRDGTTASAELGYKYSFTAGSSFVDWIETLDDDMLYVKEGDVVVVDDYLKRKILAVVSTNALVSAVDNEEVAASWYTFKQLKDFGYKIVYPSAHTLTIEGKTYDKAQLLERIKELPSL